MLRWISQEEFRDGERANPYPSDVPAALHALKAVPESRPIAIHALRQARTFAFIDYRTRLVGVEDGLPAPVEP